MLDSFFCERHILRLSDIYHFVFYYTWFVNVTVNTDCMRCLSTKEVKISQVFIDMSIVLPGLEVIKLEYKLRLKIKRNDWLLADTCPQTANHCALF